MTSRSKKLTKEIWIVAAKRTPFGALAGALKDVSAIDLAVHASKAALAQASVSADSVDQVILGNVQQTSADAIYGARHVGLKAGVPIERPALTVNRLCGSGFQAVVTAAEQILLGDARVVLERRRVQGVRSLRASGSRRAEGRAAAASARVIAAPRQTSRPG